MRAGVARPRVLTALSQRFFFLLQFRQTREDLAAACCLGEGLPAADEEEAADMVGSTRWYQGKNECSGRRW